MEFNYIADGIDVVVIDNFYSEEQLKEIMLELKWLTKPSIMMDHNRLSSAVDEYTLKPLTSKKGVFLETIFKDWMHSALISYPMENFTKSDVKAKLLEFNSLFKIIYHCDSRTHLLSYYENSDYYKPHKDGTVFTVLNYFFTEPKKFDGGNIRLFSDTSDKIADIEIKHNRIILIPGATRHEVTKLTSKLNNSFSGDGRYCNAVFLNLRGDPVPPKKVKHDSN
jgi:hypothetical protein